ncbi:hypothetical protein LXL04_010324 [Taraxacum kok-saghyz]
MDKGKDVILVNQNTPNNTELVKTEKKLDHNAHDHVWLSRFGGCFWHFWTILPFSGWLPLAVLGWWLLLFGVRSPCRFCPVEMQRYKHLQVITSWVVDSDGNCRNWKRCLRGRGQKWKLDYLDKLKKQKHNMIVYAHIL